MPCSHDYWIKMADAVEILMMEHQSIRHISKYLKQDSLTDFSEFHDYLRSVHIEIEEKIVFPVIYESIPESRPDVRREIDQIKADHKLIQTLAGNIVKWMEDQNTELVHERFPLYFRLLKEHNLNEDRLVFPWWKGIDGERIRTARREIASIIDAFGRERYLNIQEISPEQFDYIIS